MCASRSSAKGERFAARLAPVQKAMLQRAADLAGQTLTEFVLTAAQSAAEETIRKYRILELTARETEAFLAALENPPRLHPKLEEAIRDTAKSVEITW